MKKALFGVLLAFTVGVLSPAVASAYNFGDYRSVTLVSRAWDALNRGDIDAVLAYTNKCLELYGEQAKKMQDSLTGYIEGDREEIFKMWALNDVATSLFIQGEMYRKANMIDDAKDAYQKLIDNYSFGQCWDNGGWFWKPAEAAAERLDAIQKGSKVDFGDSTSSTLTGKAWQALNDDDLDLVLIYTEKCIALYAETAKEMQASLSEYPWETNEEIFSYWALNDVGSCYFIQGEAYRKFNMNKEARAAFNKVLNDFYFAQAWDPNGWFWKPAQAAEQRIQEMD